MMCSISSLDCLRRQSGVFFNVSSRVFIALLKIENVSGALFLCLLFWLFWLFWFVVLGFGFCFGLVIKWLQWSRGLEVEVEVEVEPFELVSTRLKREWSVSGKCLTLGRPRTLALRVLRVLRDSRTRTVSRVPHNGFFLPSEF